MALNKKNLLKDMGIAFMAQGTSLLIMALQSLLAPKVLDVYEFAWWQLYLFYASYVGFFHLGLNDGVYLEMGGKTREEIDKDSVKSQFIFGVLFQSIMAAAIILAACFMPFEGERRFVIIQTAVFIVLQNAASYMMYVLQCMNETRRSSYSTIVLRMAFFIPLLVFIVFRINNFQPYVYAYTASAIFQGIFCLYFLLDFAKAKWLGFKAATKLGLHSISVGISLMLSNVAGLLILGSARAVIDMRWGIETFGKLSLMIYLTSAFITFVAQAGIVLFPALRQGSEQEVKGFYVAARDSLSLFLPIVYAFYFPLVVVLRLWLPDYADALGSLVLLLPICVFDSKMTINGNTYFNVLRKERVMLGINIVAAVLSIAISAFGAYVLGSVDAVIAGVVGVIIARSLVADIYLSKELGVGFSMLAVWCIVITLIFVLGTKLLPGYVAFAAYAVAYIVYLFYYRKKLSEIRALIRR